MYAFVMEKQVRQIRIKCILKFPYLVFRFPL